MKAKQMNGSARESQGEKNKQGQGQGQGQGQSEPEGPIGKRWMQVAQKSIAQRDAAITERSNMQLHYEITIDNLQEELNNCRLQLSTTLAELDTLTQTAVKGKSDKDKNQNKDEADV